MSDDPLAGVIGRRLFRVASALFAIVFAFLVAGAISAPGADLAASLGLVAEGSTGYQLTQTVLQFVGFVVAVAGYLAITDEWGLVRLSRPTAREAAIIVGGGIVLFGFQYGALFALDQVGLSTGQNQAVVPAGDPVVYYLAMIAVSLAVVGPVEELLFRGVVQGGIRRAFDAVPAVLVASLAFGLIHLPAVSGTPVERWAYVGVVVVLGSVLGALYEWTDNVLVPGLVHGIYNAVTYVVLLAQAI
ncbi:CPBP family intramembrane glutamic endopeptidase [Halorubrum sp. 2020YC2]|uniref:CPBP family intramembrane glutamic endopeptidase n=1 Tax=Halorubrum sp. 2020YC2 TaxID=2836432 RepID=UPI001BEBA3BC|nr:CPBP family intramembrane glutamic endopeptidase [Halorubrum sp. 2020YC2]QWC18332.1 CPBP family intramembrane metalloprotease [Halorubrum sp. 2020YC2]